MIGLQYRVIPIWFSNFAAIVVPEPGKVVEIWPKHFSTILTGNDKNCTANHVGIFQVPNQVIRAQFSNLFTTVMLRHEKVVKIWLKHFPAALIGNDKSCTPNNVCMFRVQNQVIRNRFSNLTAPVVLRPKKVVKIRLKHFSVVLTGNDKNYTQTVWICFGCKTEWSMLGFKLWLLLPSGLVQVIKLRPKKISGALTVNNKNCTTNCVGIFWVQNRVIRAQFLTLVALVVPGPENVIWAPFSTFYASVVPGPEKVIKIWHRHFSVVRMRNDKKCVPNSVRIFRVKIWVIRDRFSTFPAPVVTELVKVVKIRLKHFLAVVMGNDKNNAPNIVGMFRVQNRVIQARISPLPAPSHF